MDTLGLSPANPMHTGTSMMQAGTQKQGKLLGMPLVNSNMSTFGACWPPVLQSVPHFSTSQPLMGANKLPVAAQAMPATVHGLVEGNFKAADAVQRPNTVSKWIFCL